MKHFTATEAKNRFGELMEQAGNEPVAIQKNGRNYRVVLAAEDYERLAKQNQQTLNPEEIQHLIGDSLRYNRETGNSYTASLYVGLSSLLDHAEEDLSGRRLGLFSYGSGCVAEMFSGVIQPDYQPHLRSVSHQQLLADRTELTFRQYEDIFTLRFPTDGGDHSFAQYRTGPFRLAGVSQHKRLYERT